MDETQVTYCFAIDALTPDSLPMARLAEYLADLATLFGHKEHVHFDRVAQGSVELRQRVEDGYHDRIQQRLVAAGTGGPVPDDAANAMESIDNRLAKDDATGRLTDHRGAEIIFFPGRDRPRPRKFGPFKELCSFDGMLIRVGGRDETVPVHLQAGDEIHICNADRDMARLLAPHLYQGTLRVWGDGRWEREPNGYWRLIQFDISKFELLDDSPIGEIVARLRKVEGSGWKQFEDPLAELMRLRREPEED